MAPEKKKDFIISILFLACIVGIIYVAGRYVFVWLLPFFIGFAIAFILHPAVEFLYSKTGVGRGFSAVFIICCAYAVLGALAWVTGSQIIIWAGRIFRILPEVYGENIEPVLDGLNSGLTEFFSSFAGIGTNDLSGFFAVTLSQISDYIAGLSAAALSALTAFARSLPAFVLSFIFTVLFSVFISLDYARVTSFLFGQLSQVHQGWLIEAKNFMLQKLLRYLRAFVIIMALTFIEVSLGLWIIKVPDALAIGFFVALVDLLPVLGSGSVLLPWALFCFATGDFTRGVGLVVIYVIVALVRAAVEPKIVGDFIGLHPVVTLCSMVLGLRLIGVAGLIIMPLGALLLKHLNDTNKINLWRNVGNRHSPK